MSSSNIQITKIIDPPNTKALTASSKEKTSPKNAKPAYERLTDKLQENFHISYLIVMKPEAQTTPDVKV